MLFDFLHPLFNTQERLLFCDIINNECSKRLAVMSINK
jgi:hypothetical protein